MLFNLGEDQFKIEFRYNWSSSTTNRNGYVTCLLFKNNELWHRANATWRDSKIKARKLALARCIGTTAKLESTHGRKIPEAMSRAQRKLFWQLVPMKLHPKVHINLSGTIGQLATKSSKE